MEVTALAATARIAHSAQCRVDGTLVRLRLSASQVVSGQAGAALLASGTAIMLSHWSNQFALHSYNRRTDYSTEETPRPRPALPRPLPPIPTTTPHP
jgi:hypothetical protein